MNACLSRLAAPSLAALLAATVQGLAAPRIDGEYCGKAVSGGEWVDVVTTLTTGADGLIAGSYKFDDRGQIAPGTLREITAQSGDTRSFVWMDKYGTGNLVIRFTSSGASFSGEWGINDQVPVFGWNGQRCSFDSVMHKRDDRPAITAG